MRGAEARMFFWGSLSTPLDTTPAKSHGSRVYVGLGFVHPPWIFLFVDNLGLPDSLTILADSTHVALPGESNPRAPTQTGQAFLLVSPTLRRGAIGGHADRIPAPQSCDTNSDQTRPATSLDPGPLV